MAFAFPEMCLFPVKNAYIKVYVVKNAYCVDG